MISIQFGDIHKHFHGLGKYKYKRKYMYVWQIYVFRKLTEIAIVMTTKCKFVCDALQGLSGRQPPTVTACHTVSAVQYLLFHYAYVAMLTQCSAEAAV